MLLLVIKRTFQVTLVFILTISTAFAHIGISFGSGQGVHDITPYRIAVSWDFGPVWHRHELWAFSLIWESGFAIWDGPYRSELPNDMPTDLNAFTTGPVIRFQRQVPFEAGGITPYIELGIGLSYLSKTEIQGRHLSLHFQFEDKGGVGLRFGRKQQYDIGVRAYHFSNCSIKRPNSGVNMALLSFGFWFPEW